MHNIQSMFPVISTLDHDLHIPHISRTYAHNVLRYPDANKPTDKKQFLLTDSGEGGITEKF